MDHQQLSPSVDHFRGGPLRIAGLYLLIGSLWILFSDKIAARITNDPNMLTVISLYKGWGYVLVTAILLYWLILSETSATRRSEQQLRLITNALPVLISYVDASRHYQFANQAYEEWFGRRPLGNHLEEVLGTSTYRKISGNVDKVLAGRLVNYETEIPYKDGGARFVNATYVPDFGNDGKVQGFFVLALDITAQKGVAEELRLWADAFEGCAHGIAITNPDTNRVVVCNPAFARMHKCRPEEMVGLAILNVYSPSYQAQVRSYLEKADQIGHVRFEAEMTRKDDSSFPVQMDVVSVLGQDGELLYRVATAQDITERKQAEGKSNQQANLLAQINDAVLILDESFVITSWNEGAEKIYGWNAEEALGKTGEHLLQTEFFSTTRAEAVKELQESEKFSAEISQLCKDGTRVDIETRTVVMHDEKGNTIGYASVNRDITERKQAEQTIRLKDELLRLTSEMAKVGGWEFDTKTLKGTWTDEVARIHDLDPADETNVEIGLSFYVDESQAKIEQAVTEAIELGIPYDLELEMVSARNVHKWIRTIALPIIEEGKVTKVQGIFQDITERKKTEKELQEARDELEFKVQERTAALSQTNAWLQALMDYMPDHIYFKDTQSRFIRTSRSQASMLGLGDPAEAAGKTDFDFFPHAARSYAEEQEIIKSGQPLVDLEEHVVWPDGRETWVSTTKVPLPDAEGKIIGLFGISRDITERKLAEESIRQLNANLEKQAGHLQTAVRELEAFSYSVSHDLRAPLRAIDGFTRILVEDYEALLDDEGKRVCGVISREAQRMGQLIDDLLSFSRLSRKEMRDSTIDMHSLVEAVYNELIVDKERERVEFQLGNLPSATGDTALIRQVWVNLLSNAVKFSSKKERAVIEVGNTEGEHESIYYVRDNGTGFDMGYANKLFGVFQRLHSEKEFEGTGVGLAIVQRVIHRHGGRVWAEGEVEKGATFYFAIPRKEKQHE